MHQQARCQLSNASAPLLSDSQRIASTACSMAWHFMHVCCTSRKALLRRMHANDASMHQ